MAKPTVFLEMLGLVPGRIGGMEGYARSLAQALPAVDETRRYVAVVGRDAARAVAPAGGPLAAWEADAALPGWVGRLRAVRTLMQCATLSRRLRRERDSLLHCLLMFPKPPWGARNMVVTIPDLNFELFPDCWSAFDRRTMSVSSRLAVRMAEAVITLSAFARGTLIDTYAVPPERVHAIACGVRSDGYPVSAPPAEGHALRARFGLPADVLVFPANTWPHKNHLRLLDALAALRAEGLKPCLVLTGAPKHGHRAVMDAVVRLGLADQVRWLGYVEQSTLAALYRAATALVFPSLHEGFGMPIIEAMASGCPVACSRTTATGETAGDAALTFEPADTADIARAIRTLVQRADIRQDLARRGLARAAAFSWERTARQTVEVYDAVAGRARHGARR